MKKHDLCAESGFTLVEVMMVMLITAMMILGASLTLFRSQQRVSLVSVVAQIESDMKRQQKLSMSGVLPQNGAYQGYSMFFETHRYTLFPGLVYDASNPENTVVPLDAIISLTSINFPSGILSFSRISGDVVNFSPTGNSVSVQNTQTGDTYTITINKRGALTLTP